MVKRGFIRLIAASLLSCIGALSAYAQANKGTITPVDTDDDAPPQPTLHYYDKHGERLEQPVLYLAELDTAKTVRPSSPYPLYNGFSIGANFIDAVLRIAGQNYQSYDISASISLHNWFFPIVEAGIGWGAKTQGGDLYRVKAKPAPYVKAGINYNFLYKSNPDYMAYVGLRVGLSSHSWDITDIREGSEMAAEVGASQLLGERCLSVYGEALAGLKVKIAGPFSLGWNVRYRAGHHNSGGKKPWFVPGSGTGPLSFNFSAFLTFGTKKPRTSGAAGDAGEEFSPSAADVNDTPGSEPQAEMPPAVR